MRYAPFTRQLIGNVTDDIAVMDGSTRTARSRTIKTSKSHPHHEPLPLPYSILDPRGRATLDHVRQHRADLQGVGLGFGPDVTKRWCELNKVTAVIRSHEVRQDGYAIEHDGLCITTFSCPNYCDTTGNKVCHYQHW